MSKVKRIQKGLLFGVLALILFVGVFLFTACGEEEKPAKSDVEAVIYSKYFVDELPEISYSSELGIEGAIEWDENQEIVKGEKLYTWTFTPENEDKFEVATGSVSLKCVDQIFAKQNLDSLSMVQENGSYVFLDCKFNTGLVSSAKGTDLVFDGCTFQTGYTGIGGDKCLYLTSFKNLLVENCIFGGETSEGDISSAGYALDLNIYNTDVQNITIINNTFATTSNDAEESVAISIKTRLGDTDRPTDLPQNATAGSIGGVVLISGNTFDDLCDNIYIGTSPKGGDAEANLTTGAFGVEVVGNLDAVNVFERYLYDDGSAPAQVVEVGASQSFGNKTSA